MTETTRYRHAPTGRGDPCPWHLAQGNRRHDDGTPILCYGSWGWRAEGCEKKCYAQQRELQQRANEARKIGPRIFPMPAGGDRGKAGHCSWCGDPILHHKGAKLGEINMRRGWHGFHDGEPACVQARDLHTRPETQYNFVARRDGEVCWDCGEHSQGWLREPFETTVHVPLKEQKNWPTGAPLPRYVGVEWVTMLQVDHDVPLWSVAHLPDEERAVYFGPANLRLRCVACHGEKTKLEAAQRANLKAGKPRCGTCVHRNGCASTPVAACASKGMRRAVALPCDQYFSTEQLEQATAPRKLDRPKAA